MGMCDSNVLLSRLRDALVDAFLRVFKDNLISLVLFGSYARGEPEPDSDIDLLVVLGRVDDRYAIQKDLDEVEELLKPLFNDMSVCGFRSYLSPIVLSKEQALVVRPLYIDLVFDANILYDREGFMFKLLSRLKEKLTMLGAERRRIGSKWVVILKKDFKFGEVIEL